MRISFLSCLLLLLGLGGLQAQHTFSIVAVDPQTGEVGSAGATCLSSSDCGGCGGAIIISGLAPGRGAVNAQASVCLPNTNLNYALNQLNQGASAPQALQSVLLADPCNAGDTTNRQYGVIDFDSLMVPRVAAYTGANALSFAGHRTGFDYSIQGNILISPVVLDSLELAFNRTQGPLCERLMAALMAARIPGADSRCLSNGTSSKSAFIRIAKPTDTAPNFWMSLNVPQVPAGMEPIDSLKTLFDAFKLLNGLPDSRPLPAFQVSPNPSAGRFRVQLLQPAGPDASMSIYDLAGRQHMRVQLLPGSSAAELVWPGVTGGGQRSAGIYMAVYRDGPIWQSQRISLR
jgi:uncharacterized Ntn-hydrolase superfamily protein